MDTNDSVLRRLRNLAQARRARGDSRLTLTPVAEAFEMGDRWQNTVVEFEPQGLVLEPRVGAPFAVRDLCLRRRHLQIGAFCDGTRSTYFVGHEGAWPILYTRNAAAIRSRDTMTGYHHRLRALERGQATLLAPFGVFPSSVKRLYSGMGLCTHRLADLTREESDDDRPPTPDEAQHLGSLAWQARGMRRARRMLDLQEQTVALAGAYIVRELDPTRSTWLLKDGALNQFDKKYLTSKREQLQQIVAAVKSHPVPFFGMRGERLIAGMEVGQRSVAFLQRPERERLNPDRDSLATTARPIVSWYLRVQLALPDSPNILSGVIRLDVADLPGWEAVIDELSWAVLDEFYGLSARPDPRADVMPYGIYDCEEYMKSHAIPATMLLAELVS